MNIPAFCPSSTTVAIDGGGDSDDDGDAVRGGEHQ